MIHRVELRLRDEEPMVAELLEEAAKRGVLPQQHIYDLLQARYLARHGDSLQALLWIPTVPDSQADEPPNRSDFEVDQALQESASYWLDMQ